MLTVPDPCSFCDFNDPDYGCVCPPLDKWFACPLESPDALDFELIPDDIFDL